MDTITPLFNQKSTFKMPLDPNYKPMILNNIAFEQQVKKSNHPVIVKIAIERDKHQTTTITTNVFNQKYKQNEANKRYIERLIKTLLWIQGGWKIVIGGSNEIGEYIKECYQDNGIRSFDKKFMEQVYQNPFQVEIVSLENVPQEYEEFKHVGGYLNGARIGFDAGGSDRKVSAVLDGVTLYSEEVEWQPKTKSDPMYHYKGILDSLQRAAQKLPRVDAIGVSTAGIIIDNNVAVASLFRQVSRTDFDEVVRPIYVNAAKEIADVPVVVLNDGDVTALAGSMSLQKQNVLGIAMGTSEAAGYINKDGDITGWLNELCFVPVDYNIESMKDEWSGDYGVGVTYFSQDAVIKLAKQTSIHLDSSLLPAQKLLTVQNLAEQANPEALEIFRTIGIYLGYTLAYYERFYHMDHVLILGRVTSGVGGEQILKWAQMVLDIEFPERMKHITIQLPDEESRRVGQSIAAASLPKI